MSQIQNCLFNNKRYVEPAVVLGVAFLAGSSRFISYFPGSSRKGLLLTAGLTSATSSLFGYNDLPQKVAFIAFIALSSELIVSSLNKYGFSTSTQSNMQLGLIHCAAATALSYFPEPTGPIKEKHDFYSSNLLDWLQLKGEKRRELIQKFYNLDLPAISLFGTLDAGIDFLHISKEELDNNLDSYTQSKLSWHRELIPSDAPIQDYLSFFKRCQEEGVPLPLLKITPENQQFLEESPEALNMVYSICQNIPAYYYQNEALASLFINKAPLPSFEEVTKKLDTEAVLAMDIEQLDMWADTFGSYTYQAQWAFLDEEVRSTFVREWLMHCIEKIPFEARINPGSLSWMNNLNGESLDKIPERVITSFTSLIQYNSAALKTLSPQTIFMINSKQPSDLKLPYFYTPKLIEALEQNPLILKDAQNNAHQTSPLRYGYGELTFSEQIRIRALFGNTYSSQLPGYTFSSELITQIERDPQILQEFKTQIEECLQFMYAHGRDYGLFALEQRDRDKLTVHLGNMATLLPIEITPQVIDAMEDNTDLKDKVLKQMRQACQDAHFDINRLPPNYQDKLNAFIEEDRLEGARIAENLFKDI